MSTGANVSCEAALRGTSDWGGCEVGDLRVVKGEKQGWEREQEELASHCGTCVCTAFSHGGKTDGGLSSFALRVWVHF